MGWGCSLYGSNKAFEMVYRAMSHGITMREILGEQVRHAVTWGMAMLMVWSMPIACIMSMTSLSSTFSLVCKASFCMMQSLLLLDGIALHVCSSLACKG